MVHMCRCSNSPQCTIIIILNPESSYLDSYGNCHGKCVLSAFTRRRGANYSAAAAPALLIVVVEYHHWNVLHRRIEFHYPLTRVPADGWRHKENANENDRSTSHHRLRIHTVTSSMFGRVLHCKRDGNTCKTYTGNEMKGGKRRAHWAEE